MVTHRWLITYQLSKNGKAEPATTRTVISELPPEEWWESKAWATPGYDGAAILYVHWFAKWLLPVPPAP